MLVRILIVLGSIKSRLKKLLSWSKAKCGGLELEERRAQIREFNKKRV